MGRHLLGKWEHKDATTHGNFITEVGGPMPGIFGSTFFCQCCLYINLVWFLVISIAPWGKNSCWLFLCCVFCEVVLSRWERLERPLSSKKHSGRNMGHTLFDVFSPPPSLLFLFSLSVGMSLCSHSDGYCFHCFSHEFILLFFLPFVNEVNIQCLQFRSSTVIYM